MARPLPRTNCQENVKHLWKAREAPLIDGLLPRNRKFLPSRSLRYLVGVGPVLVLGAVRGVAEGLHAAGELAGVGLLARVGPQVRLEVLQPGVRLLAGLELEERDRPGKFRRVMGIHKLCLGRLARGSFN